MARPRWDLPLPNYNRDVNELKRIYRNAIQEVIFVLEELSTRGQEKEISRMTMTRVLAELAARLNQLDRDSERWVNEKISQAFRDGQAESVVASGEAETLKQAIAAVSLSEVATGSAQIMVSDTFEDLLYANQKMKRETIRMVRAVVAEQMKTKAVQDMGRRTTREAILQALNKKDIRERFDVEGNVAIIDRAGRKWKLETYAEMVTRTKMLQAHAEGTRVEAAERGIDLAIISSHNATDECRRFEGQIISMNGQTPGYPTYDELRRSNLIFHPNCRHKITPIRDVSLLPDEVQTKAENGRRGADRALERVK